MLSHYTKKLLQHDNLSSADCQEALKLIMTDANDVGIAAFLSLLHSKPETAEELYGCVCAMQHTMHKVHINTPVIDIVGTGGDGANTVNLSTAASLVVASTGVNVAKHGNRSQSSHCGSADFIEALGIALPSTTNEIAQALFQHHFAFLYAPHFHPAMQRLKTIRRQLGIPTTFNLMGPLLNPIQPQYLLVGVYDPRYLDLFADTLVKMGVKRAMVVHSCGLDELSCLGPSQVIDIQNEKKSYLTLQPEDYGLARCTLQDIQGQDVATNKKLLLEALDHQHPAINHTIALNAGVALYLTGHCSSIAEGIAATSQQINSGRALHYIKQLQQYYQSLIAR